MAAETKNPEAPTPAGGEPVARVVKLLPGGRLVIDKGLLDGVRVDDVYAVFDLGETIVDPETGEPLGALEKVKAHFVAEHVQPRLTQLGVLDEPTAATPQSRVLSAVLADTQVAPRNTTPGRRGRPKEGDRARRLVRR